MNINLMMKQIFPGHSTNCSAKIFKQAQEFFSWTRGLKSTFPGTRSRAGEAKAYISQGVWAEPAELVSDINHGATPKWA